MDFKTFLEHFDIIAQAPNGIAKLRSLILDLAVRGKLVPQNPEDEPASIILDKIAFSKKTVSKKKKSGKLTLTDEIEAKRLFRLPHSWQWARLDELTSLITDGEHATPARVSHPEIPLGTAKNIRDGFLDFSNTDYVSFETAEKCWKRCKPAHNDILMVCVGATTGRLCLVKQPPDFVIVRSVALIRPFENWIYPEYIALAINSPIGQSQVWGNVKQSAQPCLYINKMQILSLPLPPLAEQKRIVEKVNELMALCDRLQQSQETRDHFRQKLRESAIASLMNAETDEALQKNWAIVRDNWHTLSQKPEDVADLRRSVIQLAIEGKLTGQDPVDEPAFLLVEKIKAEKKKLAQENKKKFEVMPPISNELAPSRLPEGWTMEYLGNLVINFQNGFTKRKGDEGKPIPVLRLADIKNGSISQDSLREIPMTASEIGNYQVNNGDILVIRVNGSLDLVGQFIPCLINREWAYSDHLIRVKISSKCLDQQYLCIFAKSVQARRHLLGKTVTTAGQKTINQGGLSSLPVRVPPLAEQKRIVAKVDELMQMCDQLEESLRQSQQWVEALAASAISHLTF